MLRLRVDERVNNVNLISQFKYAHHDAQKEYINASPGQEHYKLLAYISLQLPEGSKIADLGTLYGSSAIAFAINPGVQVFTFDTEDRLGENAEFKKVPNIKFTQASGLDVLPYVIDCQIIFLDVDPHDGVQEKIAFDQLVSLGFKGLLMMDDILFTTIQPLWNSIQLKKVDVTKYGHHTGTGIVVFDPSRIDVEVN